MADSKNKQWLSIRNDKSLYDSLTEPNKYKFWKHGLENNLDRVDKMSPLARSEMNKYISSGEQNKYGMMNAAKQMQDYKEFEYSPAQVEKRKKEEQSRVVKPKVDPVQKSSEYSKMVQQTADFKAKEKAARDAALLASIKSLPTGPSSAMAQTGKQMADLAPKLLDEKQSEKARVDKLKPQIDAIDKEIAKLKKERGLFGVDPKLTARIVELDKQKQALFLESNPKVVGAIQGVFNGVSGDLVKGIDKSTGSNLSKVYEDSKSRPGYGSSKLLSTLATQLAMYNTLTPVLKATKVGQALIGGAGSSIGRQVAGSQAMALFADAVVQSPIEVISAIQNKKTLPQAAKDFAVNRAIDAVFNAVIGGAMDYRSAKEIVNNEAIRKAFGQANVMPDEFIRALDSGDNVALRDMAKRVTGLEGSPSLSPTNIGRRTPDVYVNPQGMASKSQKGAQVLALPPPTSTKNELDGFTQWRKDNFGGATGKVSDDDLMALKQLYKEDTGIDLTLPTREVPRTIVPSEKVDLEARLNTLGQKVKSGEITQQEGEVIAKQITDEFAPTPKPIEPTVQKSEVIETPPTPKETVGKPVETVGNTPIVEPQVGPTLKSSLETPKVGESQGKLYESTMKSENISKSVKERLKELEAEFVLPTTTNKARRSMAQTVVSENFDDALSMVKTGKKLESSVEPFVADEVIKQLDSMKRYDEITEVIAKQAEKARASGQEVQAYSQWAKTSPEGIQRWGIRTLEDAGVKDDAVLTALYKDVKEIQTMSPDDMAKKLSAETKGKSEEYFDGLIAGGKFEELKQLNVALAMSKVMDVVPVSLGKKLSTFQAMQHLLNFKTFARNIVGNAASLSMEKYPTKFFATLWDRAMSLASGTRTISYKSPKYKDIFDEAMTAGKKSQAEIRLGINNVDVDKFNSFSTGVFKLKPLKTAENVLKMSLQTPDEMFKASAKADYLYSSVYARLGKDAENLTFEELIKKATLDEIDDATEYMKFVTFQNDSHASKVLGQVKSALNFISSPVFGKDFGLGDFVIKYTKVPGNLMTRSIEYSPLGYFRAMGNITEMLNKKTFSPTEQRKLAMELGRATTGTGLMLTGAALMQLGIISGKKTSENKNIAALERSEGSGGYKINLSALKRLVTGQSTEAKEGDLFTSYNWLDPMSAPIAVGAALVKQGGMTMEDVAELTAKESFDIPSLYIARKMVMEGMKADQGIEDALMVPLQEAIPGMVVPSMARQAAQLIDPVYRETKTRYTGENETLNKIKANVPFLSKTLPAKLSPTGKTSERAGNNIATRALESLVNPATSSRYKPTGYTDKLEDIADATGESSFIPDANSPTKVTHKKNVLELTPAEQRRWQEVEGQAVDKAFTKALANKEVTSDVQAIKLAKLLKELKQKASEKAKEDFLRNRK